jgi:hypothetical protein
LSKQFEICLPTLNVTLIDEHYLTTLVLGDLLKIYSEIIKKYFDKTEEAKEHGTRVSSFIFSNLVVPLIAKPKLSFLNKIIWVKSFNQQIFEFFFQVLRTYLQNYKKKISAFGFESFGLTMFDNANNHEKINEILTKSFQFGIKLPTPFNLDLRKFILKENCIKAYHCLHQAIDNDKIDPLITLNDTKELIIKILEQLIDKKKMFVYNGQFWKDSYAKTLPKSQFIGIPDNYFNGFL